MTSWAVSQIPLFTVFHVFLLFPEKARPLTSQECGATLLDPKGRWADRNPRFFFLRFLSEIYSAHLLGRSRRDLCCVAVVLCTQYEERGILVCIAIMHFKSLFVIEHDCRRGEGKVANYVMDTFLSRFFFVRHDCYVLIQMSGEMVWLCSEEKKVFSLHFLYFSHPIYNRANRDLELRV